MDDFIIDTLGEQHPDLDDVLKCFVNQGASTIDDLLLYEEEDIMALPLKFIVKKKIWSKLKLEAGDGAGSSASAASGCPASPRCC